MPLDPKLTDAEKIALVQRERAKIEAANPGSMVDMIVKTKGGQSKVGAVIMREIEGQAAQPPRKPKR